jgi:hypothetical protein
MFDSRDAAFERTPATPRLGPPALTEAGDMTFICGERFAFDRHNAEFQATSVQPRLLPPHWCSSGRTIICPVARTHTQHVQPSTDEEKKIQCHGSIKKYH